MISLTSPRGRRVLELRPQVVAVAQKYGSLNGVAGLSAGIGDILIAYRTPFQKIPPVPEAAKYWLALQGRCADFGFGLDVWWRNPQAKRPRVLGIVWNDPDPIEIFNYNRGDWEHEIEALYRTLS
jgi:hypothetical protein